MFEIPPVLGGIFLFLHCWDCEFKR